MVYIRKRPLYFYIDQEALAAHIEAQPLAFPLFPAAPEVECE